MTGKSCALKGLAWQLCSCLMQWKKDKGLEGEKTEGLEGGLWHRPDPQL